MSETVRPARGASGVVKPMAPFPEPEGLAVAVVAASEIAGGCEPSKETSD